MRNLSLWKEDIQEYMNCVKAKNGKSSIWEAVREGLSPAESSLERRICEVHPGADFTKASASSRIRVTYVIRCE